MKDDMKKVKDQMKVLAGAIQLLLERSQTHSEALELQDETNNEIIAVMGNLADLGKEHTEISMKIMGMVKGKKEEKTDEEA